MPKRKIRRFLLWDREEITSCRCSLLDYEHTHCPCVECDGAAVSRSTEYSHWKLQQSLQEYENMDCGNYDFDSWPTVQSEVDDLQGTDEMSSSCEECSTDKVASTDDHGTTSSEEFSQASTGTSRTEDTEHEEGRIKREIICAILKALILVDQMQGSQNDFEDVLDFAKDLYCKEDNKIKLLWPKNWKQTEKLLKDCGYKDPKELYICLDDSHYASWDVMESPSATCRHCGKNGTIKYYYLGLSDKIERWCADPAMCKMMMSHWENKANWIEGIGANLDELKEIWDGSRFNELKWFWDNNAEWMLPFKCTFCLCVISVEQITTSIQFQGCYQLTCKECGTRHQYKPKYVHGEPRNIALIGHWDGWQPFGYPGAHSCGAIEVAIANMTKEDRWSCDEIYTIGFVPSHMLPKKRACSLDPFLHPLITEIEDIFINGVDVYYALDFEDLPRGRLHVRCLILCWTGDLPAQCEVGKFIFCGQFPCRREKLKGTNPGGGSTYYIGNNRYRSRFPCELRDIKNEVAIMKSIEEEDRRSVRAVLAKDSGYTGLSILHRLHNLYGFDVIQDTVNDIMHMLPMNVIKTQVNDLVNDEKIDKKVVDEKLKSFPWTPELKDGRLPSGFSNRLGYWKAEEYQKFMFPAAELILCDYLEPIDFHLLHLTARMVELVFHKRDGWQLEDVEIFKALAMRYMILIEEYKGLTACLVTAHALHHTADDATRFSHPDNYWCFAFERAVKRYVKCPTNFKGIEVTYAKRETRREVLKLHKSLLGLQEDNDDKFQFCLEKMCAKSVEAARFLVKRIRNLGPQYADSCYRGVLIGGLNRNDVQLAEEDMHLILECRQRDDSTFCEQNHAACEVAFSFRSLLKPKQCFTRQGLLYRAGETVIIDIAGEENVVEISRFLCVKIGEEYEKFAEVLKYTYIENEDTSLSQTYTGYSRITKLMPNRLFVLDTAILRKVILYPGMNDQYIVVDYQRKKLPNFPLILPFYPMKDDMVLIEGDDPDPWIAKVVTIDETQKMVHVLYYEFSRMRDDGGKVYKPPSRKLLDKVSWDSIVHLADGEWSGSTWVCY